MTEPLSKDQAFVERLSEIVLANLQNENFGVNDLAREAGLSRSIIHRKLREIKNRNITQFIREVRLIRAMELLRNHAGHASEIAYKVGFGSPEYFNKCFHEYYGYPPGEVIKRLLPKEGEVNEPVSEARDESNQLQSDEPETPLNRIKINRKAVIFLSIAAIVIVTLTVVFINVPLRQAKDPSIVVLPFKNLSDDPENQYFADGVMEDILNNLYRINDLKVISRTTAEQLRETKMTLPEMAKKLNVNYVLEGSVFISENKVRIYVNFIDALKDQHLWSGRYDREIQDIFNVQSDIAFQIAKSLEATLSSAEIERIRKIPTKSIEAYNFYLYGRYFLNKNVELTLYNKSIEYFEKSIKADPSFAPAYAGMARAYLRSAHYGLIPSSDGYSRAKELAMEALRIDENLGEAHSIIGSLAVYEFKWGEAREEYLKAIDCEPDNPNAHTEFGQLLFALGNMDEAEKEFNKANELDPLSTGILLTRALLYQDEGRIEEMAGDLRKIHEIDSGYSNLYRIYANYYRLIGDTMNEIKCLKKVCETDSRFHKYGVDLINVYNKSGYKAALEFWLKAEIENKNPVHIAAWCIVLNKKEEALTWIEKAFEERHSMISGINNGLYYKDLRSEPRFQAIIKKMGLSEYIKSCLPSNR